MKSKQPDATASRTERFFSASDLCARWTVSKPTLWAWEKAGLLPPGVMIGPNTKRWTPEAIAAFERRRAQAEAA